MPVTRPTTQLLEDASAGVAAIPATPPEMRGRDIILEIAPATTRDLTGPLALFIICPDPQLRAAFLDTQVPLRLTPQNLADLVADCQRIWWREIYKSSSILKPRRFEDVSEAPVSESVYRKEMLPKLAEAGLDLFIQIFRPAGPEYESTCNAAQTLRELMRREGLTIGIRSTNFFVPWNLLYLGNIKEPTESGFWGYQHVIEHDISRSISNRDPFPAPPRVAVHLDEGIDRDRRFQKILPNAQILAMFNEHGIVPARRNDRPGFQGGLRAAADEHVFYFCCHATCGNIGADGIEALKPPQLFLTNPPPDPIQPKNIDTWLDECQALPGRPMIFMNACEAAQTGSFLYNGFASTFLSHHAAAVIGPEIEIPAVFGVDYALKFFQDFLKGGPENSVGKVLLRLRRQYMADHRNPLGLVYSLYRGSSLYLASDRHIPSPNKEPH